MSRMERACKAMLAVFMIAIAVFVGFGVKKASEATPVPNFDHDAARLLLFNAENPAVVTEHDFRAKAATLVRDMPGRKAWAFRIEWVRDGLGCAGHVCNPGDEEDALKRAGEHIITVAERRPNTRDGP